MDTTVNIVIVSAVFEIKDKEINYLRVYHIGLAVRLRQRRKILEGYLIGMHFVTDDRLLDLMDHLSRQKYFYIEFYFLSTN